MPNLNRSQVVAYQQIRRWSGGTRAYLVRNGVQRACVAARSEYKPTERGLFLDGSERFYIAAYKLLVPPDFEQDLFQFGTRIYKITVEPSGPRPSGLVMFYDCNCLFDTVVS